MSGEPFFDTNILVYTLAEGDPHAVRSRALLAKGGVVSVHVLNEFVAVARRKFRMSCQEINEALSAFRVLCTKPPLPTTLETHKAALEIAERYGYRIYDSLVIAAALEASCSVLYSEHMQDHQEIESLTIRNPFTA